MKRLSRLFVVMTLLWGGFPAPSHAAIQESSTDAAAPAEAVIQQFAGQDELSPQRRIETQRKHEILFLMGIALLVLLLLTGGMGIAMAAFGKDVFVAHMILAGLSMTLAIAHAVTSIVWFWPY